MLNFFLRRVGIIIKFRIFERHSQGFIEPRLHTVVSEVVFLEMGLSDLQNDNVAF